MTYSISQVSSRFNLKPHTLRYYEQEGILSPAKKATGIRYYTENDISRLEMLCCLKSTGMPLKNIKHYFDLCDMGNGTLQQRMDLFTSHREQVLEEIETLKQHLERIEGKITWYQSFMNEEQKQSS